MHKISNDNLYLRMTNEPQNMDVQENVVRVKNMVRKDMQHEQRVNNYMNGKEKIMNGTEKNINEVEKNMIRGEKNMNREEKNMSGEEKNINYVVKNMEEVEKNMN